MVFSREDLLKIESVQLFPIREYAVNWLVVRATLESEVWFGKVILLCSRVI